MALDYRCRDNFLLIFLTDGINTSLNTSIFYEIGLNEVDNFFEIFNSQKNTILELKSIFVKVKLMVESNFITNVIRDKCAMIILRKFDSSCLFESIYSNPNSNINIYVVQENNKQFAFHYKFRNGKDFERALIKTLSRWEIHLFVKILIENPNYKGSFEWVFDKIVRNNLNNCDVNLIAVKLILMYYPNITLSNDVMIKFLTQPNPTSELKFLIEKNKISFNRKTEEFYLNAIRIWKNGGKILENSYPNNFYTTASILLFKNMLFSRRKYVLWLEKNKKDNLLLRLPLDVTQIIGKYL
jgi:hypothetical protein